MNCRVFVTHTAIVGETGSDLSLAGEEARYITRVLRLKEGDRITLFDAGGMEADCIISAVEGRKVNLQVKVAEVVNRESGLDVILCQALPKAKKMDLVIQKGTELGVKRFIPFISSRSVSRPEAGSGKGRRWDKIALEAARQCGRNYMPPVEEIAGFKEMLENLSRKMDTETLKLIPWEGEESEGIGRLAQLGRWKDMPPKEVFVLIGPEGGFSQDEVLGAQNAGFVPITVGKRLLRTETAGLAVVSILQYIWGDMG